MENLVDLINNKRILVTGSSGFIGKNLCEHLSGYGANVIEYDIKNGHDILDKNQLKTFFNLYEPEIVFHLAAMSQVVSFYKNPLSGFETNVHGTLNVLECARQNNTPKVIVASSDKAYGEKTEEYTENMELDAIHPYDCSKLCAEKIAMSYLNTYNMDIVISRLCNVFGFGDCNHQRLIPYIIKQCLNKKDIILRSDGKMSRDWIYIKDAVSAYLYLIKAKPGAWNFGGDHLSVIEVINLISQLTGNNAKIIFGNAPYEINNQRIDDIKSRNELNWQRNWNFYSGIKQTIFNYKESLCL